MTWFRELCILRHYDAEDGAYASIVHMEAVTVYWGFSGKKKTMIDKRFERVRSSNKAKDCRSGVFWANPTVTSGKRQEVSSLGGPTPKMIYQI